MEEEVEVWGVSCLQLWTLLETNDVTRPEAERERESELNNSRDNRSEGSRDVTSEEGRVGRSEERSV